LAKNALRLAAKSNSENVLVVWQESATAKRYLAQWKSRFEQGPAVKFTF
jgi:hypothetical protein